MSIKVTVGSPTARAVNAAVGIGVETGPGIGIDVTRPGDVTVGINRTPPVQIELKARRTLEGDILIMDHESIDIVLMPDKNKFLAIAKGVLHDDVYGAQDRLGSFLVKSGVVDPSSIRCGNIFGSMEYKIMESNIPGIDNTQACLYSIYKYIQVERPYFEASAAYDDAARDHLLKPEDEFSTDLGDVPQRADAGSVDSRVRPFGYMYNYSIIRESEEDQ
jgi:hypothetical protein